jgi:hypothetical protein
MAKKRGIICGIVLGVLALLGWGCASLTGPHGKLVAQLQNKDAGGYTYTVSVRQFAGRFRTELGEEGVHGRVLPVSSYEFYEGNLPIKSATITWPELHRLTIGFDHGITVDCSWSGTNVLWTKH